MVDYDEILVDDESDDLEETGDHQKQLDDRKILYEQLQLLLSGVSIPEFRALRNDFLLACLTESKTLADLETRLRVQRKILDQVASLIDPEPFHIRVLRRVFFWI